MATPNLKDLIEQAKRNAGPGLSRPPQKPYTGPLQDLISEAQGNVKAPRANPNFTAGYNPPPKPPTGAATAAQYGGGYDPRRATKPEPSRAGKFLRGAGKTLGTGEALMGVGSMALSGPNIHNVTATGEGLTWMAGPVPGMLGTLANRGIPYLADLYANWKYGDSIIGPELEKELAGRTPTQYLQDRAAKLSPPASQQVAAPPSMPATPATRQSVTPVVAPPVTAPSPSVQVYGDRASPLAAPPTLGTQGGIFSNLARFMKDSGAYAAKLGKERAAKADAKAKADTKLEGYKAETDRIKAEREGNVYDLATYDDIDPTTGEVIKRAVVLNKSTGTTKPVNDAATAAEAEMQQNYEATVQAIQDGGYNPDELQALIEQYGINEYAKRRGLPALSAK